MNKVLIIESAIEKALKLYPESVRNSGDKDVDALNLVTKELSESLDSTERPEWEHTCIRFIKKALNVAYPNKVNGITYSENQVIEVAAQLRAELYEELPIEVVAESAELSMEAQIPNETIEQVNDVIEPIESINNTELLEEELPIEPILEEPIEHAEPTTKNKKNKH